MRTRTSIFLAALVLAGCQMTGSQQIPQPNIPAPLPGSSPTQESSGASGQPQPSNPSSNIPSSIPDMSPGDGNSPHGCVVSQDHLVAENVKQFLLPMHRQLTGWTGSSTTELVAPDHPIRVYGREKAPCVNLTPDGIQHIGLTLNDYPPENFEQQEGSQYIYQYTHELAHVLSNWEEGEEYRFKWFEETLSELASLHTLRANGGQGYANKQITEFAAKRFEFPDFDASGRVRDWYPQAIVHLGKNSTIRELNGAIACELLPYFESNPKLWESVSLINKWNASNNDFRSYLDNWESTLLRNGAPPQAPGIIRAVLYGEGEVSEPLSVCSRISDPNSQRVGGMGNGEQGEGDAEEALRESMGDYDREIGRERVAMSEAGRGMSRGTDGMTDGPGHSGGAMVTIPNMPTGASGGIRSTGAKGANEPEGNGEPSEDPEPKFEIPEDIAKTQGSGDQVAQQILEAAEQEENPQLREALWEEYRKHMGLRSK